MTRRWALTRTIGFVPADVIDRVRELMPTVTQDEYAGMFRECSDAFRIEGKRLYRTSPAEAEALAGFLAGNPRPPSAFPVWQSWLDQVRTWTGQGKTIARVRIIDDPPTDYQRWSLWCARWHRDAGEDIRYLTREAANALGIPGATGRCSITIAWW